MNKLIITVVIALATSAVNAEGFAPWPNPAQADEAVTSTAAVTTAASFYSAGLPRKTDRLDSVQKDVTIVPYYLANR